MRTGFLLFAIIAFAAPHSGSGAELDDAIEVGNATAVASLLKDGRFDPASSFSYLVAALSRDSTDVLRALLVGGVESDARADDPLRATAFMYASYMDRPDMMQVLAEAGADIDLPDDRGDPPINWAAYGGKKKAVAWLLDAGARLDQVGHGNALQIAKRRGFTDIVVMIAAQQLDIAVSMEVAALAEAIDAGNTGIALTLLNSDPDGASLDSTGRPLLHRAARQGRLLVVRAMLEQGVDINLKDDIGFTPLMEAARDGHRQVVEVLVSKDADVNAASDLSSLHLTAVHLASIGNNKDIVDTLHAAGAALDPQDSDGTTPALWALYQGHQELALHLVALGVDPKIENTAGHTVEKVLEMLAGNE